jgi:putative spermidine/putrescine transport system ATP-binding protein
MSANTEFAAPETIHTASVPKAGRGAAVGLHGVCKSFGPVRAVENVFLEIGAGEFLSLLGPSGSGKTTILMMLAGFETATSGVIKIGGRTVTDVPPYDRDIGMVFQSYALFPHMTVAENVAYPLRLRKRPKAEIRERVQRALEMVRLPFVQYADRSPSELSGGQKQRVSIARALIYEPSVLLMDEPMGALDKSLREELKLELLDLHQRLEVSIVYVTHDQSEALMLSDRVAVLRDGKLEQVDFAQDIYSRPSSKFVAGFLGEANFLPLTEANSFGRCEIKGVNGAMIENRSRASSGANLLVIRPEEVSIVEKKNELIGGTVERSVFLGGDMRLEVMTELGLMVCLVRPRDAEHLVPGSDVSLRFPLTTPVVVPAAVE